MSKSKVAFSAAILVVSSFSGAFAHADTLNLSNAALNAAANRAYAAYLAKNPGDEIAKLIEFQADSCSTEDGKTAICDVSIPTDYTPDTLHFTFELKNGELGKVLSFDYENGC